MNPRWIVWTTALLPPAPAWDPLAMPDEFAERQLHCDFGWSGYGW